MKQHVLGSLTAAFVVTAFGAHLPGHAQVDGSDLSPSRESADAPGSVTDEDAEAAELDNVAEPPPVDASQQDFASVLPEATGENTVSIYSHPLDERQAATLYFQSIPVLTFVGDELESLSGDKSLFIEEDAIAPVPADASLVDPVMQARRVGEFLEEFRQASGRPEDIVARWDTEQEQYVVVVGETELVSLDNQTILPDTTQEPAEDALHVANRLRRLMGGADPLEEVIGRPEPPAPRISVRSATTGMASWYGPGFHGRRSASGEVFNQNALTAAHRTLPFGTQVRVTNLHTQQQVVVRINDRGPFSHNRVIDLSAAAARAIGLHRSGVGPVRVEVLGTP